MGKSVRAKSLHKSIHVNKSIVKQVVGSVGEEDILYTNSLSTRNKTLKLPNLLVGRRGVEHHQLFN
jgi:hypothetical protein